MTKDIQRITEALFAKHRKEADEFIETHWRPVAVERDQLRAEVERLKDALAEEIQRRFDGNEISSNEHREEVQRLQAQLAQQQGGEYGDAYQGAREDLSIWKRRALEAEEKIREQDQIIDNLVLEAQGETRMGEPYIAQQQGVPDGWRKALDHVRLTDEEARFYSPSAVAYWNNAVTACCSALAAPAPVQQPAVCMGCVEQESRIRELEHKMDYYTTAPVQAEPQTAAARDVLAERQRQISAEGWTPEHDEEHRDGSLALAASCYACASAGFDDAARDWPWGDDWFKPSSPRRDLIKAGALILAEIERLDRAALAKLDGKI